MLRVVRRYPRALELFLARKVTATTLSLIQKLLTEKNANELLSGISGKVKDEVVEIISRYRPEPIRRESVRKISVRKQTPVLATLPSRCPEKSSVEVPLFETTQKVVEEEKTEPQKIEKIEEVEEVVEFRFTLPRKDAEKVIELQNLLSNKYPNGSKISEIFSEAVDIVLNKVSPQRREERRSLKRSKRSRASLRDRVMMKDGCQCSYISKDGKRCAERQNLEIDHIVPRAKGGSDREENLRVLCRAHNQYMAEVEFGREHMKRFGKG